jgi:succinoglycan biosynthesis protein ExoM
MNMVQSVHISVCICTYKRPGLLQALLAGLQRQATDGLFDYSIVVIDNDQAGSAGAVVEAARARSQLDCVYALESERNIARARNRAIDAAKGEFVALIDDDELPGERWLVSLYLCLVEQRADGVLGPVLPRFEVKPPTWVTRGRFFERPHHKTGERLAWRQTRTGNALLRKALFASGEQWFDPALGSGGEDRDFFRRKIEQGAVFVWCDEAPVHELIPPQRWQRGVLIKRALLRGKMSARTALQRPRDLLKSMVAVSAYSALLPFAAMFGQHVFMHCLIKDCDHLGKLLASMGIDAVKEKYISVGFDDPKPS